MRRRPSSNIELITHLKACLFDEQSATADIRKRIDYAAGKFGVKIQKYFQPESLVIFYWTAIPRPKRRKPSCVVCIPLNQDKGQICFKVIANTLDRSKIVPAVNLTLGSLSPVNKVLSDTLAFSKNKDSTVTRFFDTLKATGLAPQLSSYSPIFQSLPAFELLEDTNSPALWLPCYNHPLIHLHRLATKRMGNLDEMTLARARAEFQGKNSRRLHFQAGPFPKEIDLLIAYHWNTWELLDLTWTERWWWLETALSAGNLKIPGWKDGEKSLFQQCLYHGFVQTPDEIVRGKGGVKAWAPASVLDMPPIRTDHMNDVASLLGPIRIR